MIRDVRIHDGEVVTLPTAARATALSPFTPDDLDFCGEQLAGWLATVAEDPEHWPTGGNEGTWRNVLAQIGAHAWGQPTDFAGLLSGVAISGSPCTDARCRTLLLHMLQATPAPTGASA